MTVLTEMASRAKSGWRPRFSGLEMWIFVVLSYVLIAICSVWEIGYAPCSKWVLTLYWGLFAVRTLSFQLGLVFYLFLGIALWRRRWRLTLASAGLVGLHLSWWLPAYLPDPMPEPVGETIRVMSVNLLYNNRETESILAGIRVEDPEIICFQEYAKPWHAVLEPALGERYRYRLCEPNQGAFGMAIYSKRPLKKANAYLAVGSRGFPQMKVVIELDGREVALYNFHYLPPIKLAAVDEDRQMFREMVGLLEKQPLPTIVVGDFNYSSDSLPHKDMGRIQFMDPFDRAGLGCASTWTHQGRLKYFPGLRPDHIYLRGLTAKDPRVCPKNSSDHSPIIATLGFEKEE